MEPKVYLTCTRRRDGGGDASGRIAPNRRERGNARDDTLSPVNDAVRQ